MRRLKIDRIEKELHPKRNRNFWERTTKPRAAERGRKKRGDIQSNSKNQIKRSEDKPGPTKTVQIQVNSEESKTPEDFGTGSTSSNNSIDVPAINFKWYLGAAGVRYIQMRQASYIQTDKSRDLEEIARQAEQLFTTD